MTQDPTSPFWAHATALVDPPATIGAGTKVWHFAHVMAGARIGAGCSLGQNVFVGAKGVIGDRCKIQNNVSIYDEVILGDDVFVGPSAVFTNVINPRAFVVRKDEYRKTVVERGASIGANATIVCGATLGAYCFVAAGAVVVRDVAPYALVAGVPAARIGWICACGTSLAKADKKAKKGAPRVCAACGAAYTVTGKGDDQRVAPAAAAPAEADAPQRKAKDQAKADKAARKAAKAARKAAEAKP
jgi:UDP-2-acetamido-3-amino-2,3-dideoxy-glucuronate N-acetyltransferase